MLPFVPFLISPSTILELLIKLGRREKHSICLFVLCLSVYLSFMLVFIFQFLSMFFPSETGINGGRQRHWNSLRCCHLCCVTYTPFFLFFPLILSLWSCASDGGLHFPFWSLFHTPHNSNIPKFTIQVNEKIITNFRVCTSCECVCAVCAHQT